jgi:phosphoglycolate phosphatase
VTGAALAPVILFDLDGTLVDTAPEIADAVNDVLRELGVQPAPDERVREWIGEGTRVLMKRALVYAGLDAARLEELWPRFEHRYSEHCGARSRPYPGVRAALERLRSAGTRLAVVTNKEMIFTRRVLEIHDLHGYFEVVVAGDTLPVRKPDPRVIRHALRCLGEGAGTALLIGDSIIDVRTARAAGIAVWAVRHGYHHGALTGADTPDRFLEHFDELAGKTTTVVEESA